MAKASDFLVKGKFRCTRCGACCKNVWPLVEQGIFPKLWMNKKGGCKNQMKSGKCRIYETRPWYCRVDYTLKPKYTDAQIADLCAEMLNHEESKYIKGLK